MISRRLHLIAAVASAAALAVVLAGCGKDSSDNAPITTPPATIIPRPANAPANPPPNAPASSGSPASGSSGTTGK